MNGRLGVFVLDIQPQQHNSESSQEAFMDAQVEALKVLLESKGINVLVVVCELPFLLQRINAGDVKPETQAPDVCTNMSHLL